MTKARDRFRYFLLGWDPDPQFASVREYDLPDSLDDGPLLVGTASESLDLSAASLSLSAGLLPDYINNPLGWSIVSGRLLTVFSQLAGSNIEVLKVPLNPTGAAGETEYFVINVIKHLDCLDYSKSVVRYRDSQIVAIPKVVVDSSSILDSCHIFRISGFPFRTVVTREFGLAISAANASGVALIGVESS